MNRLSKALVIPVFLAAAPGYAFTALFLQDSPIANFNEQDNKLLIENFRSAMDKNADGETTEWKNAETGVYGSIMPLNTVEENGQTCRSVQIENHAKDLSAKPTYRFCKSAEGEWAITAQDS